MKTFFKKTILIAVCLFLVLSLSSCENSTEQVPKYNKPEDLDGANIGIITASFGADLAKEMFSHFACSYYTSVGDMVGELVQKKTDAILMNHGMAEETCRENEELTYLSESLASIQYGGIFKNDEEGRAKRDDFNRFLSDLDEIGLLDDLKAKWIDNDCEEIIGYESLPEINGTFTISVFDSSYPYVFRQGDSITGFEIDLVSRYCENRGYALKVESVDFSGVLSAVSTGKSDAGFGSVIYTGERAEAFAFSDSYADSDYRAVIRKENAKSKYNRLVDLDGSVIGVVTGGIGDTTTLNVLPNATISYYNSTSDIFEAMQLGYTEAATLSSATLTEEIIEKFNLKIVGSIYHENYGYIFPKDASSVALKDQLNDFIKESKANGLLASIEEEWQNPDGEKYIDYDALQDINGTLSFASCCVVGAPACYYEQGVLMGMDIDFIVEFAKAYGYNLAFTDYDFTGMLQAVSSGKVDFGGSNITITPERKESLYFSDSFCSGEVLLCVIDRTEEVEEAGFLDSLRDSFVKTFLKENRYLLFLNGLMVTILISLSSFAGGLLLGCVLFYLYALKKKHLNRIIDTVTGLIADLPTVVLLMVFYYIIFVRSSLDSSVVSIIAFTIYFSIAVLKLLRTCFETVDTGQYEAAWAFGYTKKQTYFRIIIPQIFPTFIPLLKSELINLIKATAVVGYIAVQDLTKVSDIIRSRTYEAFFPLIISTVIYIVIIRLFKCIVEQISSRIDYRKKDHSRFLEDIKTDD